MTAATTHPNASRLREMADRWVAGDLPGFLDFIADDIVVRAGGDNALTGTYRGKDAYVDYLGTLGAKVGPDPHIDVHEILASDRHGALILQARATRPEEGAAIDTKMTVAVRLDDAGRVVEWWFLPADQPAWDRFFR